MNIRDIGCAFYCFIPNWKKNVHYDSCRYLLIGICVFCDTFSSTFFDRKWKILSTFYTYTLVYIGLFISIKFIWNLILTKKIELCFIVFYLYSSINKENMKRITLIKIDMSTGFGMYYDVCVIFIEKIVNVSQLNVTFSDWK